MDIFLKRIKVLKDGLPQGYPFSLPLIRDGLELNFTTPVTFIVGENGTGKSTLLENLAYSVGFNTLGGNRNHNYKMQSLDNFQLSERMQLTWSLKQGKGFFFRAETFFDFARNLDEMANFNDINIYRHYGGKSLQKQSHGESFISFFANRVGEGLYILDEPESALSPEKQFALLVILNNLSKKGNCQFLIATHSPILITLPNSTIYEIEDGQLNKKDYKETRQFILYKRFIDNPNKFLSDLGVG